MSINEKKEQPFGAGGSFAPNEKDAERDGGRRNSTLLPDGRRKSRIGPPPGQVMVDSDTDSQNDHGRLVEMEAENAIKYRTCSWQKVINSLPRLGSRFTLLGFRLSEHVQCAAP